MSVSQETVRKADFKGGWVWELPRKPEDAQEASTQTGGTLGDEGHLQAAVEKPKRVSKKKK